MLGVITEGAVIGSVPATPVAITIRRRCRAAVIVLPVADFPAEVASPVAEAGPGNELL